MQNSNFAGQPNSNEYVLNEQPASDIATTGESNSSGELCLYSLLKDWSSILSSTTISCTTALKFPSARLFHCHTFLNIDIENIYLSKRQNTHSVLIGTLLAFLCDRVPMESGVPRILTDLIQGVGIASEPITVATTHVPSFGDDMENTLYGYQPLRVLSSIHVGKDIPPVAGMQLDQELLAVNNNPMVQDFAQTWSPCGMDTSTHFIVIFTDLSTPLPNVSRHASRHASPFSHLVRAMGSTSGSHHSSVGFQTPSSFGAMTSPDGLGDSSADASRTSSPMFGMDVNQQSSDSVLASQLPSRPVSQDAIGAHLVPGTNVETVCRLHGITDDVSRAAKYKSAEKKLLGMVLNHRHMLEILVKLGLQERYGTIFIPSKSVTYAGGLQLAALDVVTAFGWSGDSYKHKTLWFGWAAEASSRQWVKSIPSK